MIFRSSSGSFNTFIKLNWTVLRNFLKLIEVITSTMFWKKMLLLNCSVPPNSKNASGKRQNSWGKKWTRSWSSTCFWLLKIFNCFSSFESIGEVVCICILILKVKEANLLPTGAHTHTDGENQWKLDPLRSALPPAAAVTRDLLPSRSVEIHGEWEEPEPAPYSERFHALLHFSI